MSVDMSGTKRGDVVMFTRNSADEYVRAGQEATVICVNGNNSYECKGVDSEGDENEWTILSNGSVQGSDPIVWVEAHPAPVLNMTEGTRVHCRGETEEEAFLDCPGTVTRIDTDGDHWIEFDEAVTTPDGGEIDGIYVDSTGTGTNDDYKVHVTVVTTSPVGEIAPFGFIIGEIVTIRTGTINDNHGVSINGFVGHLETLATGRKYDDSVPVGAVYWVEMTDSQGVEDGFYVGADGKANRWNNLWVEHAQARPGTPVAELLQKVQKRAVEFAADQAVKAVHQIEREEWEMGHKLDCSECATQHEDEIFPWPQVLGSYRKDYRINGHPTTPVKRKVVYYEWEEL